MLRMLFGLLLTGVMTCSAAVIDITSKKQFEDIVIKGKKPSVVKFHASWCGACKIMKPRFEELEKELGNTYLFAQVDVDKVTALAHEYSVRGIPLFLFFKNGKRVAVDKPVSGAIKKKALKDKVEKYLMDK